MNVKKNFHIIRKDEGSGLILTLLTLMVISILGATLGTITVGSYNLGDVNRDDNSAYYIAEAGANMAYEEFNTFVNDAYRDNEVPTTFFNDIKNFISYDIHTSLPKIQKEYTEEFSFQFGSQPKAVIEVTQNMEGNSRDYTITSTGIVEGKERTVTKDVTVNWIDKSNNGPGSAIPPITTTVAKSKMTIDNNVELTGAIHIDSKEKESLYIGNNVEMDATVYIHPEADKNTSIKWQNEKKSEVVVENREAPLDWSVYDELLESFPETPSTSNADGWSNVIETDGEVKTFVFDDLSLVNDLQINGGGKVNIFVKNSLSMGNVSINQSGNADQLQIFYSGTNTVKINETIFNGTLFVNQANLEVDNKPILRGLIISGGSNVDLGKGVTLDALVIAPNAKITLSNSSNNNNIRGIIIGDEVYLVNNLKLYFDDFYLKNFPLKVPEPNDGDGSGGGSNDGELIITKPGVEN